MANKNNTSDSEHADTATEYSEMKVWKATLRVTVQYKARYDIGQASDDCSALYRC